MRILDRYILRQFLINFIILSVVLLLLFVLIDLIVNMNHFVRGGEVRAQVVLARGAAEQFGVDAAMVEDLLRQRRGAEDFAVTLRLPGDQARRLFEAVDPDGWTLTTSTLWVIMDYYGPLTLVLFLFFSGMLTFGAMGFTCTQLLRTREMTAMVASGLSLHRIALPILIGGMAINALAFPVQEWLIPPLASKLARGPSDVRFETIESFPVHLAVDHVNGLLLSAGDFDARREQLRDLVVLVRDAQQIGRQRLTASLASWDEAQGGWELLDGGGYATILSDEVDDVGRARTLLEPMHVGFLSTQLSPTVLLARQAPIYSRLLSLRDLQAMEANEAILPAQRQRISQVIWSRFSLFVINVLALAMGLAFFVRKASINMFPVVIMACGVCLGALFGGILMLQVSSGLLNPIATAWLPVVLYLPVTAWLLQRMDT